MSSKRSKRKPKKPRPQLPEYGPFWDGVSQMVDAMHAKLEKELERKKK